MEDEYLRVHPNRPVVIVHEGAVGEGVDYSAYTESTDLPSSLEPLDGIDVGKIEGNNDEMEPLVCIAQDNVEPISRLLPMVALPEANFETAAYVSQVIIRIDNQI